MKTRRIHSSAAFVTTLLLSAVLAACGGGGSGGDSNPPPPSLAITAQPVDQSVVAGGIARFTVQATGNGLTYQWQLSTDAGASWSDVSGASGSSLEVSGVTTAQNNNQYRAKVSNGSSTITTSAVTLKVSTAVVAPTIDVDVPASVSATVGGAAAISVTASGTSLGYQWQRSTDGGSSWADISGETAATLNLSALAQDANGWRFRVAVSNSAGTVTSGVTTLQVSAAPVVPTITTAPASMEVVAPATATFTVVAAGQPTPTYQWQRSTDGGTSYTDISGATGASYTTDATSVSGTGAQYRVKVTNSAGSVTSDAAVLTVKAATAAPAIQTQPSNATVTAGGTATFTVAATGTPTPTIQWQVSTDGGSTYANITGATAASYTTGVLAVSDSNKRFRAVVTNSAGSVQSSSAVLTVNAASGSGDASKYVGTWESNCVSPYAGISYTGTDVVTSLGASKFRDVVTYHHYQTSNCTGAYTLGGYDLTITIVGQDVVDGYTVDKLDINGIEYGKVSRQIGAMINGKWYSGVTTADNSYPTNIYYAGYSVKK